MTDVMVQANLQKQSKNKTMGFYKRSLEILNAKYRNQSNLSIFGGKAGLLILLIESYEVYIRFKRLLEMMRQGPVLINERDFSFLSWADEDKWIEDDDSSSIGQNWIQTASVFGFDKDDQFLQNYANHLIDALGEQKKNIDVDLFKHIVSSTVTLHDVFLDFDIYKAIDDNINQIRETLVKIGNIHRTDRWSNDDFAQLYSKEYNYYESIDTKWGFTKRQHQIWLDGFVEPTREDYNQRRRELLLDLFQTRFLRSLRKQIYVPAEDDLNFSIIQDERMMPDLTETLKYYAAFKKLCPRDKDGMFRFDGNATIGKYMYSNCISRLTCQSFIRIVFLIKLVQDEMYWLEHPEEKPQEDTISEQFVMMVTRIMTKAEERNGEIIKYKDNKQNNCQYKFYVDGKLFCAVMDEILKNHPNIIDDYLDGKKGESATGVTKVGQFIGCVVGMHLFNDEKVRNLDFEPAFKFIYGEKNDRGQKRSFIQKMSATNDIKDKSIFDTIKTVYEAKKNDLLNGK